MVNAWFKDGKCPGSVRIGECCWLAVASEQILAGSRGRRKIFYNSISSTRDGEQTRKAEIPSKYAPIKYYAIRELGDVQYGCFLYSFPCE